MLYMATASASRCNPVIKAFYQRLRKAGAPVESALSPCATLPNNIPRGVASMGRIVVETTLENALDPSHAIRCDALIDTGAAYFT